MRAARVVISVDMLEYRRFSMPLRFPAASPNQLILERLEKRFDYGIEAPFLIRQKFTIFEVHGWS